jgi:putative ABC transport system ATP-binding protein
VIRLEDVHVTFNAGTMDEVRALRGLSLTLGDGELVTVVGSNGAGKSTLLNTIAGVIFPRQGRIFIGDEDVTEMVEHRRARHVGRVFQNPLDGTAAGMTVEENLSLASRRGQTRGLRQAVGEAERRAFRDLLGQIAGSTG